MSLYEVLKASKTERFPDYWTLLWGRKMSSSMIKTITGVLPLTFTAKGGTAADWTIYGNDENGTENFFQTTATSSSGGGFIFAVNNDGSITVTGTPTLSTTYFFVLGQISVPAGTYTITGCPNGGSWGGSNPQTYCTSVQAAGVGTLYETGDGVTVTAQSETTIKLIITLSTSLSNIDLTYKPMVVEGSTAPDHYIPYQQGVGERTKNLYEKNTYTEIRARLNSDGEIQEGTLDWQISDYIPIEANENYTISNVVGFSPSYCLYDSNKNYISGNTYANNTKIIFQAPANAAFARFSVKYGSVSGADPNIDVFMVTKGSIAPDYYIPYGYQIPITVSQQGQTDKTYDIFIGDSPLTEGETVSKTSTGVDIELFEGENTVSTTLYNKPEMKIKYK